MKKKSSQVGRLFLILFALPFAGIGVFATVMVARALWTWNDMRSWVPRPATILHAELETRRGDDSSSYLAIARYEYEFKGRKYQGTRVGVHTRADSVGSFHQKAADQLKQHQKSGQPFTCYVDPGHPANSVLYRHIRIELLGFCALFALLFGGVGFGLLFWSIYSVKLERKENALVARHADQPWMWKPDWSAGQIKSSTKTAMFVALAFATFWNLISAPVVFFVPGEVRQGNHLALLALIFPLVGAGLMIWALRSVLQWLKYRDSVFQMASVPGVIGGQLAGVVRTRRNLNPPDGFRVTLSCINRVTTGSGKNRSTSERVVWQDVQQLDLR
ncbi:MAG: DUF3592 domain-containing protein [Planctomycetota bacterium]|nr:DUF3592 domain-containing protein [Planctomycetota bacterium]